MILREWAEMPKRLCYEDAQAKALLVWLPADSPVWALPVEDTRHQGYKIDGGETTLGWRMPSTCGVRVSGVDTKSLPARPTEGPLAEKWVGLTIDHAFNRVTVSWQN